MRRVLARPERAPARPERADPLDPVLTLPSDPARPEVRTAVLRFLVAGFTVLVAAVLPIIWWIGHVAEEHALDQVLSTTHRLVDHSVSPLITDELLAGDAAATAELDVRLQSWLADGTIQRLKIWSADGTVVYSDEHELIGQNFGSPHWDARLLARSEGIATFEHQQAAENLHEARAGELVEVYTGFSSAGGEPLVFEAYYDDSIVREVRDSVLLSVAPALLVTMLLFQLVQLVPAVGLARRIQAHRTARAQLLQHAVDAAELERVRVARDLHDDVIQDLAGLSYALEAQEMNADPAQRGLLGRTRSILQGSLRTLRGITTALYSPDLLTLGLPKALARLADPLAQRGVDTAVQIGPDVVLTPEQEATLLKVAREAFANIAKHAHASTVTLALTADPGGTVMTVSDDGTGFDPSAGPPQGHLGLRIMRDVAEAGGAGLEIRSAPGVGTTVVTTLPSGAAHRR